MKWLFAEIDGPWLPNYGTFKTISLLDQTGQVELTNIYQLKIFLFWLQKLMG